jgi:protein SCO1/2
VNKVSGLILFIGLCLFSCQQELEVLPLGGDITLTDQNNQPYTLSSQSQVTWVFFGFTHCPDVCPNTLARLASAEKKLDRPVRLALVSIDPRRDTPAVMKQYLDGYKFKSAKGLTGTLAEIEPVARKYGVFFDQTNPDRIVHQKSIFLLDDKTQLRLIFRGTESPDEIADQTARLF